MRKITLFALTFLFLWGGLSGQKFLLDDPIARDPDDLDIPKPAVIQLGATWDYLINTYTDVAKGALLRAENMNTLGEVPDSSWFTNRIGSRSLTVDELVEGNNPESRPDMDGSVTVLAAALLSFSEGLIVEDQRGRGYYLIFDPKDHPNLVSGASLIANRIFHAAGYHVLPNHLVEIDPAQLQLHPQAQVVQLGGKLQAMDSEYLRLTFEDSARLPNGNYRALAIHIPADAAAFSAEGANPMVGEFQFHGRRSDDPNDLYLHENRRELRGMRLFAAWLNFPLCNAMITRDLWMSDGESRYLKHFLVDFSGALGTGRDWNDRPVPKDRRVGYESFFPGNLGWTLKTALTLGFWYRPWMTIDFASASFPEIGIIEAEHFQPNEWVAEYPNGAFSRMLPDDAFWAARIISRFSDQALNSIVAAAEFRDPGASRVLVDILKRRRDKIVDYYFSQINPLHEFRLDGRSLDFRNLGEERGLGPIQAYDFEWYSLDNPTGELRPLANHRLTALTRIEIPSVRDPFLMVRLKTRSQAVRGWRRNVDVYLRMGPNPKVVGIEREVGVFILERALEGRQVVRSSIELAGTYEGLETDQRRLIDNWVERINAASGRALNQQQFYADLPMSFRTTFEGVTHALMESALTDETGVSLGTALDLVAELERVNGKIEGVKGDRQFRIYCRLVPNATGILQRSQEFRRGADNTVYHKGYPINYRQSGGVPSIQISISESGERADIDVDYRSSGFPSGLVNGHLTSANSDVRVGDNHWRHVNRWQGFLDWWRGLFGIAAMREMFDVDEPERLLIPANPRKGKAELVEEAVEDFFSAWLLESKPEESVAYFSEQSFNCMGAGKEEGRPDFGVIPYLLLEQFQGSRAVLGNPRRLEEAIAPVAVEHRGLRPVELKRDLPFSVYEVSEAVALALDCTGRDQLMSKTDNLQGFKGDHLVVVRFVSGRKKQPAVGFLWKKESGNWRITSFEVEPAEEAPDIPDIAPPEAAPIVRVAGDSAFQQANRQFLDAWGQGRIAEAVDFLSPDCAECFNLYRREGQPPLETWEEVRPLWEQGLRTVYEMFPKTAAALGDTVQAVEVHHPDIRVVDHEYSRWITLMSLPDHLAQQYDCKRIAGNRVDYRVPQEKRYGNYYATAIRFNVAGEDPAVLYLVWSFTEGSWKITSYAVLRP